VGAFIGLKCRAETLTALAEGLTQFGPADGEPAWLVSGVWLATRTGQYVATATAEVLGDGHVARPLNIASPNELAAQIAAEASDVSARLLGRGSNIELPSSDEVPSPPRSLKRWRANAWSTVVLVRVTQHASTVNRVACALLFAGESGRSLLVGTDVSSLAMVLSEDPDLIARYRIDCEEFSPEDYAALRPD
jgi:hypothetical protein